MKRIVSGGSPSMPCAARDRAREQAADRAVDVADRQLGLDRRAVLDRRPRELDQLPVERARQRRVLRVQCGAAACRPATSGSASRFERSTPRAFQWSIAVVGLEQVDAADQVLEARDAELRP